MSVNVTVSVGGGRSSHGPDGGEVTDDGGLVGPHAGHAVGPVLGGEKGRPEVEG